MENNKRTVEINISPSFLVIVTIILLVAKIWGKISISWLLVFAPLWLPFALILGIFTICLIIVGIQKLIERFQ